MDEPRRRLAIADLRREYVREGLREDDLDPDPFRQFERWFAEAMEASVVETNAMTLATATADGRPSARIVLLKGLDDLGFVFFTNYESRKGRDLEINPYAALLFYWAELSRQVRVEGVVSRVSVDESVTYFNSRGRASRIGAWASRQSSVIESRAVLDARVAELECEHEGRDDIPLPSYWGGFRLIPDRFEFWHGQPSRLHDRMQYTSRSDGAWKIERLSP